LRDRLAAATVIAVGPGLGQSALAKKLLTLVLKTKKPLVVDADALNLLAKRPIKRSNWILTPHPGEAARLLNCTTTQIQKDRFAAIKKLQKKYGGTVVLKGCGTLVFSNASRFTLHASPIFICPFGNPKMASGGMGDVLTGMIASLIAQGFSLEDAAKMGVCWHARAGDKAAQKHPFILASDVISSSH
jgi:NAD(P)H-hydrate epimerase